MGNQIKIRNAKNPRKSQTSQESYGCQEEEESRILRRLHLQSPQAGPPRDWNLQEIHEHHELLHLRYLRENRWRVIQARQIQQKAHSLNQRGPDRCQTPPPRRAYQARRLRGNQSRYQILIRQVKHNVNLSLLLKF